MLILNKHNVLPRCFDNNLMNADNLPAALNRAVGFRTPEGKLSKFEKILLIIMLHTIASSVLWRGVVGRPSGLPAHMPPGSNPVTSPPPPSFPEGRVVHPL